MLPTNLLARRPRADDTQNTPVHQEPQDMPEPINSEHNQRISIRVLVERPSSGGFRQISGSGFLGRFGALDHPARSVGAPPTIPVYQNLNSGGVCR